MNKKKYMRPLTQVHCIATEGIIAASTFDNDTTGQGNGTMLSDKKEDMWGNTSIWD